MILRHLFSPLNNTRLSHLCGPTDAHLRSIEVALQVKIAHRHQQFKVDGTKAQAKRGMELLQALSAHRPVELYLLTPCRDLWQRREGAGSRDPLSSDWLLEVPGLEARFGRLGAEFQQLLEGSGESQLGEWREGDLFFAPAAVAALGTLATHARPWARLAAATLAAEEPALRGAARFGGGDVQWLTAGAGIQHQHELMRGIRVDAAHHAADFFQFLHQVELGVQAPGRVDDDHIGPARDAGFHGIPRHAIDARYRRYINLC